MLFIHSGLVSCAYSIHSICEFGRIADSSFWSSLAALQPQWREEEEEEEGDYRAGSPEFMSRFYFLLSSVHLLYM